MVTPLSISTSTSRLRLSPAAAYMKHILRNDICAIINITTSNALCSLFVLHDSHSHFDKQKQAGFTSPATAHGSTRWRTG